MKLNGEDEGTTLLAASNYASSLVSSNFDNQERFEEARSVLRKMVPVARRVLGEGHGTTLGLRANYCQALYRGEIATLDDIREAVTILEDLAPFARRVLGGAYPLAMSIETTLRDARAALHARETPSPGSA